MDRLKKILGFLIVVAIIYGGWTIIPVYLAKFQFEDDLGSIAKFSADHSEDQLRDEVMKKAKDDGVPLLPDNIHITKDQGRVTIDTNYQVILTYPGGKQLVLSFAPTTRPKDAK